MKQKRKTIRYMDGVLLAIGSLIGGSIAAFFDQHVSYANAFDSSAYFLLLFTILYFFMAKEVKE